MAYNEYMSRQQRWERILKWWQVSCRCNCIYMLLASVQEQVSYPLKCTGSKDLLVSLGLQLFAKQDVASNGPRKDPGLLWSVRQLTFGLYHALVSPQFPQNSAEQRRLVGEVIWYLFYTCICYDKHNEIRKWSNWNWPCQRRQAQ